MWEARLAESAKRRALLFLGLVIVTTLLIGIALPRLTFQPGMPLPAVSDGEMTLTSPAGDSLVGMPVNTFLLILFLVLLCARLAFLAYRLLRDTNWREAFAMFGRFVLIVLIVTGLLYAFLMLLPASEESLPGPPPPAASPAVGPPLGPTPRVVIWLVAAGLLVGSVLLGVALLREKHRSTLATWQFEAEQARLDLLAGADLREVIVRCYRRMSEALQEEQHIVREVFMTTGEFERLLTSKGVPREPVHQLTKLFDAVRYGHWQPEAGDESRAIQCLNDILAYSRSAEQER
jgi:uncharacterized membrane protein YedE/YeeE